MTWLNLLGTFCSFYQCDQKRQKPTKTSYSIYRIILLCYAERTCDAHILLALDFRIANGRWHALAHVWFAANSPIEKVYRTKKKVEKKLSAFTTIADLYTFRKSKHNIIYWIVHICECIVSYQHSSPALSKPLTTMQIRKLWICILLFGKL